MPTDRESHAKFYRRLIVAAIALAGIAASTATAYWAKRIESGRTDEEFKRSVDSRHSRFVERFTSHIEALHGLKLLFINEAEPSRATFSEAAREMLLRHPSFTAIEWIPYLKDVDRARVEQRAASETGTHFSVTERGAPSRSTMAVAGKRDDYLPILFAEPSIQNGGVLGYDLKTGPTRELLARAQNTGQLVTTGRIPLWQDAPNDRGMILILPVFAPATNGEHRGHFRGFIQGVFIIDHLLADTWTASTPRSVETMFLDLSATEPSKRALFYIGKDIATSDPTRMPSVQLFRGASDREQTVMLGGRDWQVVYRPADETDSAGSSIPLALLGGGLLTTLFMSGYVRQTLQKAQDVEIEVAAQTSKLQSTQAALEKDIVQRMQAERALAASEIRYRAYIEQSREPMWRCELDEPLRLEGDPDVQIDHILQHGYIAECNRAMAEAYGFKETSEIINMRLNALMDPKSEQNRAYLKALLASPDIQLNNVESHELDRLGRPRIFLNTLVGIVENGRLLRAWGTQRDITERRKAEEEKLVLERRLQEAQKLESLGMLAGGIAHDFNNLLTGILGNATLASQDLGPGSRALVNLKDIEASALRAAALCHQLLAYAGKGRFSVQRIDVRSLIESTIALLKPTLSKRASLHFKMPDGLPGVTADETQLSQIIMNLVINASESLPDTGGQITITTGSVETTAISWSEAVIAPENPSGSYVWIEVRDTGAGMSPDVQARVFEPFYTTKFAGRGLGLAAVLGIISGHKGGLIVRSQVNQGSSFRFFLPASNEPILVKKAPPAPASETRYRGTVMIVDDEDPVRFVATRMLEICGFQVISARDGVEAVEVFQKQADAFVLILLDLTMPRMGGDEVLGIVRTQRPQLPVILMSGYSIRDATGLLIDEKITGFLQKPYTFVQLKEQLRRLLG